MGAALFCMSTNMTGSLLPELMTDYEMHLDSGGMMSLFQYLGCIMAVLLMTKFADRMRKQILLILALAVVAATQFLIGGFPPFVLFMVLYLIMGAGLGAFDTLNNAVVNDLYSENRNAVLSIMHAICSAGAAFIPIFSVMVGTTNWETTYRTVALIITAIAVMQIVTYMFGKHQIVPSLENRENAVDKKRAEKKEGAGALKDSRIWVCVLSMFFFGMCQSGVTIWCVKYCRDVFSGAGVFECALSLSLYWLGALICRFAVGLVPRLKIASSKGLIVWGGILGAAALLAGVLTGNYIGFLVGVFVMGILNGASLPRAIALMTGWYPDRSAFTAGISYIALYLAYAFIPLLMGVVASAFGMQIMMVIPVIGTLVSGLIGLKLPNGE